MLIFLTLHHEHSIAHLGMVHELLLKHNPSGLFFRVYFKHLLLQFSCMAKHLLLQSSCMAS